MVGGRGHELLRDVLRLERDLAAVLATIGMAVLADDQRGDADRMRRRHRRALEVLVVGAHAVLALPHDERRVRAPVGIEVALGDGHDSSASPTGPGSRPSGRCGVPNPVTEVAARGGHVGVLDPQFEKSDFMVVGPTAPTLITWWPIGRHRQARVVDVPRVLGPERVVRAGVIERGVVEVGVLVALGGDERHAVLVGVVERPVRGLDDRPLLLLLLGRVGRVVGAVVQPRVDVVAHVDDVDAVVGGVGQRVDRWAAGRRSRSPGRRGC